VAAILVGVLKCRTHFWKRTIQWLSLDGSLPKMCPAVRPFYQDDPHSRT
jgi:hypothetical protein